MSSKQHAMSQTARADDETPTQPLPPFERSAVLLEGSRDTTEQPEEEHPARAGASDQGDEPIDDALRYSSRSSSTSENERRRRRRYRRRREIVDYFPPPPPRRPSTSGSQSTEDEDVVYPRTATRPSDTRNARHSKSEKKRAAPVWFRVKLYEYSKDYRSRGTATLLKEIENDTPIPTESSQTEASGIFEVTHMCAGTESSARNSSPKRGVTVQAMLGIYLTIRSSAVLSALRSIVKYYPRLALYREPVIVADPFCVFFHYREEFKAYCDKLEREIESASATDATARTSFEHLSKVLEYVESHRGVAITEEISRHKSADATCTFEYAWLLYKPGAVVYAYQNGSWMAYVVESHDRDPELKGNDGINPPELSRADVDNQTFVPRRQFLKIKAWYLDFGGEFIGRNNTVFVIPNFDGERPICTLPAVPKAFLTHEMIFPIKTDLEQFLIDRGKSFFRLTKRSYCNYYGETVDPPKRMISSRIMVDQKYYYREEDDSVIAPRRRRERRVYDDSSDEEPLYVFDAPYQDYDKIDPLECDGLNDHQYLICASAIHGFVLKNRQWERLYVSNITEPKLQTGLINDLVLEPEAKALIQALSKKYGTRKDDGGEGGLKADFIRNKGEGQIFLLHGKPGVGKTSTAECVAELTGRPLLALTCGDLGIDPSEVEEKLMKWMKLATTWDAVLLLDEADVYLESRISQDLQRNSLVSIFLRALEYYQGVLFLTSNRVGSFDDAFISRIHVIIHYPDFTHEQRAQIWDNFFKRLERESDQFRVTHSAVDYAEESKEVKELGWNGREIRNAFNTAVALAEYDNERNAQGLIMLYPKHLEQVVKMSGAFRKYLKSTHGMDEAEKAKVYRVRDDYWRAWGDVRRH